MRGEKCEECDGLLFNDGSSGEANPKMCDCREKRHALRQRKHDEAVGHLKEAVERQSKVPDASKPAVLLAGMVQCMLALLEASRPGDY